MCVVWCGENVGVVGVGMRSGPFNLCHSRIWPEVGDNYRHSLHTSCQQAWVIVVADDFRCCVPRNDTPAHFVTPGMGGEVTEVRPDLLPRECPFRAQEMLQPSLHQQVDSSSQVYDSRVAKGSRMLPRTTIGLYFISERKTNVRFFKDPRGHELLSGVMLVQK